MKPLVTLLFFFLAFSMSLSAQTRTRTFMAKFGIKRIELSASKAQKIDFAGIRSVLVRDFRVDSTTLGFMQQNVSDNRFVIRSKKVLEKDISQLIREFTSYSANADSLDLLLVINKLWLTDEIENEAGIDNGARKAKEFKSGIMVKFDFALTNGDDYYPLLRFDTVISRDKYVSDYARGYIFESLYFALAKVASLKLSDAPSRLKKLSFTDIINYYGERSNIGVLTDTVYKKGIYKNFAEFKRNAPSIFDYEIKFGDKEDIIYEKGNNGSYIAVRDVWGFCDGETIYIRSAENFFALYKRGQAFYTYGAKSVTRSKSIRPENFLLSPAAAGTDRGSRKTVYTIELRPYQLDLLSGKLY